jgi:hypothetical protein
VIGFESGRRRPDRHTSRLLWSLNRCLDVTLGDPSRQLTEGSEVLRCYLLGQLQLMLVCSQVEFRHGAA